MATGGWLARRRRAVAVHVSCRLGGPRLALASARVLPNHSPHGPDHAPIVCPAGHHTMTTREHLNQRIRRSTSAASPSRLLRWWWWLVFLLVWSCCVPGCATQRKSNYSPYISWKSNKPYKGQVNCSDDSSLRVEKRSWCVSEIYCRAYGFSYNVYWMKRQCVSKCPPNHTENNGYCSLTEVCRTVRISNLTNMEVRDNLMNCRIIEGSIEIVLIKDVSEDDWKPWRFPHLLEITDFLLVYQVESLKSLGQLFPNLTVIRGMKLLYHYSLVIYNTQLENIGLYNLRSILRGSVRIQNNINLCYVHTVNWDALMNASNDNVLTNNIEPLCKNCCPSCSAVQSQEQHCQYCWSSIKSQQICRQCDHGCTASGKCCHPQCAGGCLAPVNNRACIACRNFNTGDRCVETCGDLLEFKGYRCVTKEYCQRKGFFLFNGTQCVTECPGEHNSTGNGTEGMMICSECCGRSCHGLLVNTVARAQELRGCTSITGSLIISIRYGKTVTKELESSLGAIQRVTHYIRIFKTSPLKSLSFLQSLKVIEGRQLYNDKYALFVHDNANLEDIWDFSKNQELNITKGKIFFHGNPKLCYNNKIETLLNLTGQEEDYSMRFTNGDKVACSIMKAAITLQPLRNRGQVRVRWIPVSTDEDDRKITGYYIYYKETKEKNIGHMDGRDACNDGWKREHVEAEHSTDKMEETLTGLKPDHRYAVYVETDTVADADIGARSNISYITTMPYNPGSPLHLRVVNKGTTHMDVAWSPPSTPLEKLFYYKVKITLQKPDEDTCQDFCKKENHSSGNNEESVKVLSESMINRTDPSSATTVPPPKCCPCPAEPATFERDDIDFRGILHSHVYVHRTRISREKRSIVSAGDRSASHNSFNDPSWSSPAVYTEYPQRKLAAQNVTSVSETDTFSYTKATYIRFTNLSHYSQYKIEVSACHMEEKTCPKDMKIPCQLCSIDPTMIEDTTAKKDNANKVVGLKVENITFSSANVSWVPPISPNGPVLKYVVFISNVTEDFKHSMYVLQHCVSPCGSNRSLDEYYPLEDLRPGTMYRVKVEAHSRAPLDMNDTIATADFTTKAEDSEDHGQMLLVVAVFLLLAVMSGIFVFRRVQLPKPSVDEDVDPVPDCNVLPKQYIVDPSTLLLKRGDPLGWGNFGLVLKGELQRGSEWVPVAVKLAIKLTSQEDMVSEARLMLELKSFHIVRAYGVMIESNHTYLVMEYMSNSDLLKYLRQQKTVLETEQVCDMALQIADGMAYLASKNYMHRDLAARNCLLDENMKIKISDFGMAQITDENYYHVLRSQFFPVRWVAPECFNKQRFTMQSDVWSYGIVLWEILTNGRIPYEELKSNEEVMKKVSNGHTLKESVWHLTNYWLANLICRCWESEGHDRPSFLEIISILQKHASPQFMQLFRSKSFYYESRGQK
ncbi:insulin receptor-like isoform X2 [Portunus trituberculatus]|uniref:insulin receptor-like isoform X2 n=1 Tax=Portunus trituberculatus TaxID=210409 RepID=UPI001E1CBC3A|nr:insulin receptor-like isoform X2 [Portunus trituberculatus]